jgi:hypothetical protein
MMPNVKHVLGVDSGRAVSSVVEHFLDTEGVRGSNPLSRTILYDLMESMLSLLWNQK